MSIEKSQISELLFEIISTYPAPGEASQGSYSVSNFPELPDVFRQAAQVFQTTIDSALGSGWRVDYSFGQETLIPIPYIAVFREDVTVSTQRGVYIAWLFDPVDDSVYLTLNQGITEMNRLRQSDSVTESTPELLFQQAEYYRGMPGSGDYQGLQNPWKAEPATLSSSLSKSDNYNQGTILYTSYNKESINGSNILQDLVNLVRIYDSFLDLTYKQLELALENKRAFGISVPSVSEWSHWVENDYGITGIGEQSDSGAAINPGDVLIAGRSDNITDYVMGVGVVEEHPRDDVKSALQTAAAEEGIHPTDGQLYHVDWKSFYSRGVPVTVPREGDELFNQLEPRSLSTELVNRLVSAVGHRYGAIEGTPTRSLADSLLSDHTLEGSLRYTDLPRADISRDDERAEVNEYWEQVETKRTLASRFVDSPQQATFAELVDPDHFRATRAFGSLDYYLDELVFADKSPEDIASTLSAAVNSRNQEESLEAVLKLDGFGWPVATEILHALAPEKFATLNAQVATGMSALGVTPPSVQTAETDEYVSFIKEIQAAVKQHQLATKIVNFTGESIPDWASDLEVAERAAALHVSDGLELNSFSEIKKDDVIIDTWSPPTNVFDSVSESVTVSSLHFPEITESDASLAAQIDHALRSGKHIILTGPPGTGKTELAKCICRHYVSQRYSLVTATDDWSTFDTIGGYQPDRNQQLVFTPGVFLQRFLKLTDPPKPKNEWLIIDELNRADIDKAFGSLFSALTGNNVTLPFENEDGQIELIGSPDSYGYKPITSRHYYIPPDWRMIATMNTDDKSTLYRMSYAFMRRFAFISVPVPTIEHISVGLLKEYTAEDRWDIEFGDFDEVGADEIYRDTVAIWQSVQQRRRIGPALIKDVLEHIEQQLISGNRPAYAQPVATYIFPQLEGLSSADLSGILDDIDSRVDMFDRPVAERFAADYLNIDV